MKQYTSAWLVTIAIGGGVIGAALRMLVLSGMDDNGLLPVGSHALLYLMLWALAVTAAVTVLVLKREKTPNGSDGSFAVQPTDRMPSLITGLLTLAGGWMAARAASESALLYLNGLAVVCGLLIAVAAMLRSAGKPVSFWMLLPLSVFATARLILDFKDWSFDPHVVDFCYRLLSDVALMLALHFLSGFPLRVGKTRAAILWSLLALSFTLMCAPDLTLRRGMQPGAFLISVGLSFHCLLCAIQLLRKQPDPPVEETPDSQELPLEDPEETDIISTETENE